MSECHARSCCGESRSSTSAYESAPYIRGLRTTLAGEVPVIETSLSRADHLAAARVRFGVRRNGYRVKPGLYTVGDPDDTAPALVTANYKLSFDALRRELRGRSAWVLVLDTQGVNVWCAAAKGTFGTDELVSRVRRTALANVVSHFTLVVPQLGAPGIAAHEVRTATGFRVIYGPVRAADLPAFLDDGMRATSEMRRVRFDATGRLAVAWVEVSPLRHPWVLGGVAVVLLAAGTGLLPWYPALLALGAGASAVLAGALVVPLALPWIPGRAFALKGALAGAAIALGLLAAAGGALDAAGKIAVALGTTSSASFIAMNYTGSSTFTSLSGVLWEMRRAIPLQVLAAVAALAALAVSVIR